MFFLADLHPLRQARRHRLFTMGDNHGGAAAVLAFLVVPYVLLISYLALVLVPFADLHVVKLTNAYLLLTSVIKLT
jgi:hypothetical protein